MERWREIEESCHSIKECLETLSDYVLAIPDSSVIGDLLTVDKMAKGETEILHELPRTFNPLEMGTAINGLEKRGVFIPNNFNLLGKAFYLDYLRECGIPIPWFEILDLNNQHLSKDQIRNLSVENGSDLPPLFIVKPARSHRGEGIRVITEEELAEVRTEEGGVIVQRFWWPWRKSGYVRDARVVTIDGEPRDFCVRQAREPLIDIKTGKLIEYPPSLSRVLANVAQGGEVVEVPRRLQTKLLNLASRACASLKDYAIWMRENNMRVEDPQKVNLGLISIDILLGEDGLAVCEMDTMPDLHFFPDLSKLGKPYIDYLKRQTNGGKKPVLLFQEMLGSRVGMPIPPKILERLLEQEGVSYIPFSICAR